MRYIELGNFPKEKKIRHSLGKKKNPFVKVLLIILLVVTVGYGAFLLFWPTTTIISKVLKAPMSALSFIQNPEGELKSTDGRTNILLLGIDKRSDVPYSYETRDGKVYHNGFLSDTIMVISINASAKDLAMISFPRDLWITIPGWGGIRAQQEKINAAYSIGASNDYPGGGAALARETISQNFDLPIHYVARIDFEGFKKLIDTIGGVDVVVENTFDDWNYPIDGKETAVCADGTYDCRYEHMHFDQGLQHMDGKTALKFARSRKGTNGEGSDFARAKRQQKIIFAAREKALSLGNLTDPIKLAQTVSDLGETLETDLDLINVPPLSKFAGEVDISKARTLVVDPTIKNRTLIYNPPAESYGGAWVLAPIGGDYEEVSAYIKEFLVGSLTQENTSSSAER